MKSLGSAAPEAVETMPAQEQGPRVNARGVALTTAAHFTDDIYPGFVPALLPVFIDKFGLSLALAGLLGSVLSLSTSLGQFGFGWLADRVGRKLFLILGPLSACVFLSLAPLAGSYGTLLLLVAAGGIGVAAFHPSGASLTGFYGGRRKNFAVSIFSAAGTIGFATGPLLIIAVVMNLGLERSYVAMVPGLVMVGILAFATPKPAAMEALPENGSERMWDHSRLFFLLWFVAVIRAAVIMGFENFIPIMVSERGGSLLSGGASIFLFLICGSAGGILGGYVSDKMDPRRVMLFSSLAPVPLLIGFLRLSPPCNLICLGIAGAFLFAAVPVTIVMAQELVPGRTSTASSLVMGVAWGVGGFSSAAVGSLADAIGLSGALTALAVVSIASAPCVPFLPSGKAEPRWVPVQ